MRQEERRKEKEDRRTGRQKQVFFHNRTYRTSLLFACVETPHSNQKDGMDFDMDEEVLSFVPCAVSHPAGWHELQFQVRQAMRQGRFQVLRHRVGYGGRRGRPADTKLLPNMLQYGAMRKKSAGDKAASNGRSSSVVGGP